LKYPLGVAVREKLAKRVVAAGLSLPETAFDGMEAYFELLRKWNLRLSLTSLDVGAATDDAIDRLLIEPALAAAYLPGANLTMIDIGSGGGSPAIPIKLMAPGLTMVMVESTQKKAAFLREVIRHLGLARTTVESARFEDLLEAPGFRASTDVVTARAVKCDSETLAAVEALMKPGGSFFRFSSVTQPPSATTSALATEAVHSLLGHLGTRLEILRKAH
jgi:16S rRNA (guanine527-N7)-methyltransferase